MTTLHYVKKARKPIKEAGIKKGDSYYWWQFAFSSKQVSKTHPCRSQYMTRSPYLGGIYDIEDQINALTIEDLVDGFSLDDICSDIESIRDEAENSLDNIPDQLKGAPAGAALQEYIDNLESWQQDLEQIDIDNLSDDSFVEEATAEWDTTYAHDRQTRKSDGVTMNKADWIGNRAAELLDEHKEDLLNEIQGCSYPG